MSAPNRPEDLPRLSDADREAAGSGYVAIEGVPVGGPAVALRFVPGDQDGDRDASPMLANLVYLHVRTQYSDDPYDFDQITGYVRPNVAALVKSAPTMLAKLKQIAGECCNCDGGAEIDGEPCENCKDVREVIAAAEGRQS